ncbi:extracellular catalytic domain type 1 short-chain-length polyhydroxyalkanoate depolymerase [Roseicella aquatilis]|uniref:PHB depolymerase family esterase n=1 Tax=Roseicella aquatilis TaxID=2527868 RepID=A0A4V2WM05_9PROT|nr:PHB depolymerase family esterase [Roseicella aquatilis]TCZ65587.1 PHB depolymerase family esterase [Roseicella aquatilis]
MHIDIADLVRRSHAMARAATGLGSAPSGDGALREVPGFGNDPGNLRMLEFVPESLPPGAPLVVALHGCTQTAGAYDRGTGWSTLAARQRFALLLPEQRPTNNANRCFNWFEPAHTARDRGEAASIQQMVAHMVARHRLDPKRVFVTGLSAGGAMTSVMLATYPESFAAGAIIAGLPYGAAQSAAEAFEAMAIGRPRPAADWAEAVRRASPHPGPWPRVAVWQGDADTTVRPANAQEILKQWRALHGLDAAPETGTALSPSHSLEVWRGPDGRAVLEHHAITGLAHGVPIAPGQGEAALGEAAPFILDADLSSTEAIAGFFGLDQPPRAGSWLERVITVGRDGIAHLLPHASAPTRPAEAPPPAAAHAGPGAIIRRALRAAGLLDR